MDNANYPIVSLLKAYFWFDEGLQNHLRARGWPTLSRAQSLIMIHVCMNVARQSDIARELGLTRQAVHATVGQIVEIGIFSVEDDPDDGRSTIVRLTPMGQAMRRDARRAMSNLTDELGRRIPPSQVAALLNAVGRNWGDPAVPAEPTAKQVRTDRARSKRRP